MFHQQKKKIARENIYVYMVFWIGNVNGLENRMMQTRMASREKWKKIERHEQTKRYSLNFHIDSPMNTMWCVCLCVSDILCVYPSPLWKVINCVCWAEHATHTHTHTAHNRGFPFSPNKHTRYHRQRIVDMFYIQVVSVYFRIEIERECIKETRLIFISTTQIQRAKMNSYHK